MSILKRIALMLFCWFIVLPPLLALVIILDLIQFIFIIAFSPITLLVYFMDSISGQHKSPYTKKDRKTIKAIHKLLEHHPHVTISDDEFLIHILHCMNIPALQVSRGFANYQAIQDDTRIFQARLQDTTIRISHFSLHRIIDLNDPNSFQAICELLGDAQCCKPSIKLF